MLTGDLSIFEIIKQNITPEDFQDDINRKIVKKLYEEFEKGNSNINSIIDSLEQEEQNQITMIMAEDYEIENLEKAIDDIMQSYEKDKLDKRKFEILELLEKTNDINEKKELESLEADIPALEQKLQQLDEQLNQVTDFHDIQELSNQRNALENEIETKSIRWLELLEKEEQ